MDATLIKKLETAIERLTAANGDNCQEDNDIGWNARDQILGHSLAHQIGNWTAGQIKVAWKLASTYRRTQLADLDIPQYRDDERGASQIAAIVEARNSAKVAAIAQSEGFGLKWTGPKTIVLAGKGPYNVWSAPIPPSHPFWALWQSKKEELKAQGYSLRQYNGWQLNRWEPAASNATGAAPRPAIQPYEIRPVNVAGLLEYQIPSVERLVASVRAFGAGYDASDVGTGKTYTALATFRELGISPVVVAPLSVLPSWEKAAKHFGMTITALNWERVRNGNNPVGKWNDNEKKKTFYWAPEVKGLIFDECHRAKSHTTQNHRLVAAAKRQNIPTLALSATAATNPLHLKALGYLLGLHQYKGFWQWVEQYGCTQSRWGGYEFDGNPAHLRRLHAQIFEKKGVRIRVAELGDKFPETQITTELIPVADAEKINKAYAEVEKAINEVKRKGITDPEHHLTKLLRARQISELGKVPSIIEWAEDAVEQGLSVAVFVNFDDSLRKIVDGCRKAGLTVGEIHGKQTPEERQAAIDGFQADQIRVIVCNIRAGGVGVSLHDLNGNHPRLSLISPSSSAIDVIQAAGRVHRAGGKTKSRQRLLFAAGTVEERTARLLEDKCQNLQALNDGLTDEVLSPFALVA